MRQLTIIHSDYVQKAQDFAQEQAEILHEYDILDQEHDVMRQITQGLAQDYNKLDS